MEYGTLNVVGTKVNYFLRSAEPGAQTIVFVHGIGCSKQNFLKAAGVKALNNYNLVAFDMPGCGMTYYPKDKRVMIADLIEMLDDIMIQLNFNSFYIVGHSMGGVVGLLYASTWKYRHKVKGFMNIEGNLGGDECYWSRKVAEMDFEIFESDFFPSFKRDLFDSDNLGMRNYARDLDKISPKAFTDYAKSLVAQSDNGDLLKNFINLKIPKIYVYGEKSTGLCYLKELKNKNFEVAVIPDAQHFVFHDNPDEFYGALVGWVSSI